MKRRLGSKTTTGIFFMERPFFDVDVELKVCTVAVLGPAVLFKGVCENILGPVYSCVERNGGIAPLTSPYTSALAGAERVHEPQPGGHPGRHQPVRQEGAHHLQAAARVGHGQRVLLPRAHSPGQGGGQGGAAAHRWAPGELTAITHRTCNWHHERSACLLYAIISPALLSLHMLAR